MVKYKLTYSDGTVREVEFPDQKEAWWFIYNEGDHLIDSEKLCESISSDVVQR